jgi:Ni/Fe-hydrogenase 1 B-type cytochrome subunit
MSHQYLRVQHPLVFVLTHWINLLSMIFLTLSGLYIHFPIFGGLMGAARGTHFFWMFVLLINLLLRIVLAFIVKDSPMPDGSDVGLDVRNFVVQKANVGKFWKTIGYYLFIVKDKPEMGKYNPLQKLAYLLTIPLTLLAAYTGFCLWAPTMNWAFFQAGTVWFASLFNAGGGGSLMPVRILHYWTMWAILSFTFIHVYLAYIYGFAADKIMFAWQETK